MERLCRGAVMNVVIVLVLVCETLSTVIIKETKVEPFSLMLENQRQMLDKIEFIVSNMKGVDALEAKVSSLSLSLSSTRAWVEKNYHNVHYLNDGIKNITNLLASFDRNQQKPSSVEKTNSYSDMCFHLIDLFQNGAQDVGRCTKSLSSQFAGERNDVIYSKRLSPDTSDTTKPDNYVNAGKEENQNRKQDGNKSIFPDQSNRGKELFFTSITRLMTKNNVTNQNLLRVLSLLQNIEYRQHISALTQDRRLSTLLHKMAIHQSLLEERLLATLKKGFKETQENVVDHLQHFEIDLSNKDQLLNNIINVTTNLSLSMTKMKDFTVNPPSSCSKDIAKGLTPSEDDLDYLIQGYLSDSEELLVNNSNVALEDPKTDAYAQNLSDYKTELVEVNSYQNFSEATAMLRPAGSTSVAKNNISEMFSKMNSVFDLTNEVTPITLTKRIAQMENLINKRMTDIQESLTSLRIHPSSSFSVQTKELHQEMENLEHSLLKSIHTNGNKMAQRVEATRKSLFTFIDAAVTSISSAAVTSAKSAQVRLTKELQEAIKQITELITKTSRDTHESKEECPGIYRDINGTCLLALNTIGTTWWQGCRLCKSLNGSLVMYNKNYISILTHLLNINSPEYLWVRNRDEDSLPEINCESASEDESLEELTNSLAADLRIRDDTRNGTDDLCRVAAVRDGTTKFVPCSKNFGVICQYKSNKQTNNFIPDTGSIPRRKDYHGESVE